MTVRLGDCTDARSKRVLIYACSASEAVDATQVLLAGGLYDVMVLETTSQIAPPHDAQLVILNCRGDEGSALVAQIRKLRRTSYTGPILIMCTEASPLLATSCLRAGADDFMPIPFTGCDLAVRVYRLISSYSSDAASDPASKPDARRSRPEPPSNLLLNENDWAITIDGAVAELTEVPFRLVQYLVLHSNRWVRASELQVTALRAHAAANASNVRFQVHKSRALLGEFGRYLHGWPRRGYMWSFDSCNTGHCAVIPASGNGHPFVAAGLGDQVAFDQRLNSHKRQSRSRRGH